MQQTTIVATKDIHGRVTVMIIMGNNTQMVTVENGNASTNNPVWRAIALAAAEI